MYMLCCSSLSYVVKMHVSVEAKGQDKSSDFADLLHLHCNSKTGS